MKFGRRAFLQFTAGLVGGTLLTPIPWKLADDSAIWTQNWPWEPSPGRGEITKTSSICLLCEDGCGIQARLVDGSRAIMIQGNPKHPVNRGGVCALAASGLQFLYAPYRITQPMKQTKQRGDVTGFKPITWDEAGNELKGVLTKLRAEERPQSVACITGQSHSSMHILWQQFFKAYGSPNLFTMPCGADSQKLAVSLALGQAAPVAFALEKASYILSFSTNLLESCSAPGRAQAAYRQWREEEPGRPAVKFVQVEAHCSLTAAKADDWVAVKPGSDAALALGMAHVIIRDKLYDADFVSWKAFGFEDWTDPKGKSRQGFKNLVMDGYTPEKVEEMTGVDAGRIVDMGREFAGQKNGVAVWGNPCGDSPNNLYSELAFLALNALVGNLKPGGTIAVMPDVPLGNLPDVAPDAAAQKGLQNPRLDLVRNVPAPGNGVHAFLDAVANKPEYPIDVLFVHEANPAYSLPDNQVFKAAMARVGLLVSFSPYMDETAQQADLILPNHCAFERTDDVIGLPGATYAYYAVAKPILKPQLDTKHTGDLLLDLGSKLEGSMKDGLPWKSYEEYLKSRVSGLAASGTGALADTDEKQPWKLATGEKPETNYKDGDDLWKKLTGGMCWYDTVDDSFPLIQTGSGNYEFALAALAERGLPADEDRFYLPHFAPLTPSGDEKEYPLMMVSYQMLNLASKFLPNPPFLNKSLTDTLLLGNDQFIEIHPKTAVSIGLREGDRGMLKTPQGEVSVRVHLTNAARPGVVFMAQGLGHTAYDEYIRGKGVNANNITEVQIDPVTGLGTVWATRAQLRRV